MFSSTQIGGFMIGLVDVCKTPIPPIPHPNMAMSMMTIPIPVNVLTLGGPKHNMASIRPISLMDTAGVGGGIISQRFMAKQRDLSGAFTYITRGTPTTRVTSIGITNGFNCGSCKLLSANFRELVLCA